MKLRWLRRSTSSSIESPSVRRTPRGPERAAAKPMRRGPTRTSGPPGSWPALLHIYAQVLAVQNPSLGSLLQHVGGVRGVDAPWNREPDDGERAVLRKARRPSMNRALAKQVSPRDE